MADILAETEYGYDTSDATATPSDILSDKTAYARGEKITGTMPSKLGGTFEPTASKQVIFNNGTYPTSVVAIKGDANLKPSNIKKGVGIFGVVGTVNANDPPSGTLPDNVYLVSVEPSNPLYGSVYGGGGITDGFTITVNSVPNEGAQFYSTGWQENGDSLSSNAEYTFEVTKPHNLIATFSHKNISLLPDNGYVISVSVGKNGGGTASQGNVYASGSSVVLYAWPSSGYVFEGWKENGKFVSTDTTYSFTADSNRNLIASFAPLTSLPIYNISAIANPVQYGTIAGAGQYRRTENVTLTATGTQPRYRFVAWKENGETVSENENYKFVAEKNRSLVAEFTDKIPVGYTVIEYIESSGKSYINTGIKPTSNTIINMDVEPTDTPPASPNYDSFLGSYYTPASGTGYSIYVLWGNQGSTSTTGVIARMGSYTIGSTATFTVIKATTAKKKMNIRVDTSARQISADGTAKTVGNNTFSSSMTNIFLLAQSVNTATMLPAKLYSCTIHQGGKLVRDFVPCLDPSGIAGMYDAVNNTFYASARESDQFTAGPTV